MTGVSGASTERCTYGTSVPVPDEAIGSGTADIKVSQSISGLKPLTPYHFRVVGTNAEGTTYSEDETFTTAVDPRFLFSFGSYGTGNGQFQYPEGIAVDSSGYVWVSDTGNHRVEKWLAK